MAGRSNPVHAVELLRRICNNDVEAGNSVTKPSRLVSRLAACALIALAAQRPAHADSATECEQAGRTAEQTFGLPSGLLLAIGKVESGRWDVRTGSVVPWPWSIDAGGQGRLFDNAADAIAAVRSLRASGSTNIDVGCFQINLGYHPDAFASLAQAFDPEANAHYAAKFLAALQTRLGNWQDAVAAYHSATPDLGVAYQQRVFAAWSGGMPESLVSTVQFTAIAGVHVWGPSPAAATPQVIAISASLPSALPHVITPGTH